MRIPTYRNRRRPCAPPVFRQAGQAAGHAKPERRGSGRAAARHGITESSASISGPGIRATAVPGESASTKAGSAAAVPGGLPGAPGPARRASCAPCGPAAGPWLPAFPLPAFSLRTFSLHALSLIALSIFALLLTGCGPQRDSEGDGSAIAVRLAPVALEETAPPVYTSGRLSSGLEARLSFKVGGIVENFGFDEGEAVNEGDVLASLNPREIDAQAAQARSAYEKAKRDHARAQDLYADSVIALESLQDAGTGLEVARSAHEVAEFNLAHSVIRAPADGKVLKRYAETNEMVAPGQPILLFGSSGGEWTLRASVNDREVIRLAVGDSATARFDAYPGRVFMAGVSGVAGTADRYSGGYEVELKVDPDGQRLMSGFVAEIEIHPMRKHLYRVIPVEALVEADGADATVYTVDRDAGRARGLRVTVDHITGANAAVSSGLEDVQWVVTDGASYLADSSLVNIAE